MTLPLAIAIIMTILLASLSLTWVPNCYYWHLASLGLWSSGLPFFFSLILSANVVPFHISLVPCYAFPVVQQCFFFTLALHACHVMHVPAAKYRYYRNKKSYNMKRVQKKKRKVFTTSPFLHVAQLSSDNSDYDRRIFPLTILNALKKEKKKSFYCLRATMDRSADSYFLPSLPVSLLPLHTSRCFKLGCVGVYLCVLQKKIPLFSLPWIYFFSSLRQSHIVFFNKISASLFFCFPYYCYLFYSPFFFSWCDIPNSLHCVFDGFFILLKNSCLIIPLHFFSFLFLFSAMHELVINYE